MSVKPATFLELLRAALKYGASDLHIREGESPCFRIHGDLIPIKSPPVKESDVVSICSMLIEDPETLKSLGQVRDLDGAKSFEEVCRVRFNFFRFQGRSGLILRLIKDQIPDIEELRLSPSLLGMAEQKRGLILITGPTGSGKSTTMAALIDVINQSRDGHIVTVEDPVEYLFEQKRCRITQREVGIDTMDFNSALRSVLRQDPDVIVIGEMRDSETVDIALKAAETGHLVISTIHTSNCENTIGRVISMFEGEEQKEAKMRLADNLQAIVSQRLIKEAQGEGLLAVQEIMITGPGIRNCIAGKEDMANISTYIRESHNPGSINSGQTFDQHLKSLLRDGMITKEEAYSAASSGGDFIKLLGLEVD